MDPEHVTSYYLYGKKVRKELGNISLLPIPVHPTPLSEAMFLEIMTGVKHERFFCGFCTQNNDMRLRATANHVSTIHGGHSQTVWGINIEMDNQDEVEKKKALTDKIKKKLLKIVNFYFVKHITSSGKGRAPHFLDNRYDNHI